MNSSKQSIYSFDLPSLENKLLDLGLKKFNAKQVFQWIYQSHVTNFELMTNIAKSSIKILNDNFVFNKLKNIKVLIDENDETTKFLFELSDKQVIETVLMKFDYGYSVCISSQVGCNMGCKFCASGLLKKIRNLTTDELVLQVLYVNDYLRNKSKQQLSNLVVMGIGEPFDNYENLKEFLNILNSHFGIGMGSRHITVSTCGLINKIIQFGKDFPNVNLAVSLHAPNNQIRNKLMPINQTYPLEVLLKTLVEYQKNTKNRITIEYILLKGVNDSMANAKELVKLLKPIYCYVNLIRYNQVKENEFITSNNANDFSKFIDSNNIICTIRLERGTKISAACGQLRANYEKSKL